MRFNTSPPGNHYIFFKAVILELRAVPIGAALKFRIMSTPVEANNPVVHSVVSPNPQPSTQYPQS